ncbi:MAG: ankyrin repeat protein [Oceanospirillaceae bacterium]
MKLLNSTRTTPYPTVQALLREIAGALDTKSYVSQKVARKLDDSCSKKIDIHIGEFEELKKLVVIEPLIQVFNKELAARLEIFVNTVLEKYFGWIELHPLDGLSVKQANQLFNETNFFSDFLISTFLGCDIYGQKLCLPGSTNLILQDKAASDKLIQQIEIKEAKDRVRFWISGTEKPSFKYVEGLERYAPNSDLNIQEWADLKWSLIASRFVTSLQLKGQYEPVSKKHSMAFKMFHSKNGYNFLDAKAIIQSIFIEYRKTGLSPKTSEDKVKVERWLEQLKFQVSKVDPEFGIDYVYHQLRARHLVLSGDLKQAKNEYVKAFDKSLYRAHSQAQIQLVIKEALKVAAYQKSPDKVFITRLKSTAILFGLDQLPAKTKSEGKNKLQVVSNNEIEAYRVAFLQMFPEKFAYPHVTYPRYEPKVGIVFGSKTSTLEKKINKKKIKIGVEGSLQRATSPIIEAATKNDVTTVKKLLNSGASVNVTSEVGDSPLLMALSQLDYQSLGSSMDDSLFKLISEQPHGEEVLNTVSTRKMQFPLYAAIETGDPKIVKKVLSMSSDIKIDLQGGLDFMTPLYQTLALTGLAKNPNSLEKRVFENLSSESIHRLKPMLAGIFPIDDDDKIKDLLLGNNTNEWAKNLRTVFKDAFINNYHERCPAPAKLRQIARILIRKGADVDLDHRINGIVYTPLMLAAEMDEIKLFKLMIEHGGCWDKTYTIPTNIHYEKKAINCLDIAKYFGANNVVKFIETELI